MLVAAVVAVAGKEDIQLAGTAEAEAEKVHKPTTVLVLREQPILVAVAEAGT
jgi:hypothetical protein